MKADGTKGYAARETYDYESTYKLYLVPVEQEPDPEPEQPQEPSGDVSLDNVQTDKIKVNSSNNIITVVPDVTLNDLTSATKDSAIAKNQNGDTLSTDSKLATGTVVNDKYTVVMLGDINCDGKVDTADLLAIQKQLLNIALIEGNARIKAADINYDSKIDTADLLAIQKKLLNISDIHL